MDFIGGTKLNIGMVTGGLKFAGDSLEKHSLGGSETAFLSMARELAKRGHSVRVWVHTDRPGIYDGVEYLPLEMFEQCVAVSTFDVLIASRWPEHLSIPSRAALRILWLHDTLTDKGRLMGASWQTDQVFLLSDFHIENYCGDLTAEPGDENPKVPELHPHIWKTSNGVDLDLVEANIRPKVPGKVIYTSRPERGLLPLLSMMPELIKRNPTIKLYYANYSLDGMQVPPQVAECIAACDAIAAQMPDHVVKLGHMTKDRLYQEISSAQLLLYPTSFPEISCITAMEAQACGTPIITTKAFALKETVADGESGILIEGSPDDSAYCQTFIEKTTRLLQRPEAYARFSEAGPRVIQAKGFTWKQVAASWEKQFASLFKARAANEFPGLVRRLMHNGDLRPAQALAKAGERYDLLTIIQREITGVSNPAPVPANEIPAQFGARRPLFDRMTALLQAAQFLPKRILDVSSGYGIFGLFAAKNFQGVSVTIAHDDPESVRKIAANLKLNNVVVISHDDLASLTEEFNLLVLGGSLERSYHPAQVLKSWGSHVKKGGAVAFYCDFGPNAHTLRSSKFDRLWSFDFSDIACLFPRESGGVNASFVPGTRADNGHWVGIAPVLDVEKLGSGFDEVAVFERRELLTRPYRTLGASMIVKNEEDNLLSCLKAIRPYCDEIIVADTGSTDSTVDIARKYADEVRTIEFDNFSQARNDSRAGLTTDWYLWLDADEELLGGENLRKYLDSTVYNGVVIRQQHLMLDVQGTFDTPIRLLRNKPEYKFVGLIHEHCEDTSRGPYGHGIRPSIIANDLDLAHYGYPSESIRRKKCSNRNMQLMIRDLRENPDRPINKLLFMRDCLNIVKWHISTRQPIARNSIQHALLNTAVALYLQHFSDPKNKHYKMTDPLCQEALKILAAFGLPFEDRKLPPFEVALALGAAIGKPVDAANLKPSTRVFIDDVQFNAYMAKKLAELSLGVGGPKDKYEAVANAPVVVPFLTDTEAAVELLNFGANCFR
jgi:glycosyltransferase involved in cell wall biosynthesis